MPAKNGFYGLIVAIIIIVIAGFWVKSSYNEMVVLDENVKTAWAQVENQYQRRADLIPNLVNTVKGYASHEQQTLEGVTKARSEATKVTLSVETLDDASFAKYQDVQGQLGSALSRLLAVSENYPALRADQSFRELQVQLEGTENRISVERKRFNDTARVYNTHIRSFPAVIMGALLGFKQRGYFTAASGAETAPPVTFSSGS